MKQYKVAELSKLFNKSYQTVNFRFNSPYADKRWGVIKEKRPDGSIRKYVPENKLYLWEQDLSYVGKPVFEDGNTPDRNRTTKD